MANPTASPLDTPSVDICTHITINAGAEFEFDTIAGVTRVWLGGAVAALELYDIESTDRLINELCEALAYMRHEQANAKRCEARATVVA